MRCLLYIRLWLGMFPRNLEKEEIVIDLFTENVPNERLLKVRVKLKNVEGKRVIKI